MSDISGARLTDAEIPYYENADEADRIVFQSIADEQLRKAEWEFVAWLESYGHREDVEPRLKATAKALAIRRRVDLKAAGIAPWESE